MNSYLLLALIGLGQASGQGRAPVFRDGDALVREMARLAPVVLTAPVVFSDGSRQGPLVVAGNELRVHVAGRRGSCDGSITASKPDDAREGWFVSARELAFDGTTITMAVEWRRLWSGGKSLPTGGAGKTELTLTRGDRAQIDHLPIDEPGLGCHGQQRVLELRYESTVSFRPPPPLSSECAAQGPCGNLAPESIRELGPLTVRAWLVSQVTGGPEAVRELTVPFDHLWNTGFSFRTAPIRSEAEAVYVEFEARLRVTRQPNGNPGLWVGISRGVFDSSSGRRRYSGGSSRTIDWPAPSEVVSFEIPIHWTGPGGAGVGGVGSGGAGGRGSAAGAATGMPLRAIDALFDDRKFSLRLQVTSTKR